LAPVVGDVELEALTVHNVDLLDQELRDRGLSVVSRRHTRGLLSRILKHAKSKGMVAMDVTADADKIRAPRADRSGVALESESISALLATAKGTYWETHIALLALLGLRRGELLGLSWESINLEECNITIDRNLVTLGGGRVVLGSPKTVSGRRTLHLSDRLVSLLRAHRRTQVSMALAAGPQWVRSFEDEDGAEVSLVFTDEVGRPLPGHRINSALKRIAKTAGLDHVNPHRLRHSAASLMIDRGMNPAAVGDVLGHASAAVTMTVYAHALGRSSVVATDSIAAAVGDW
jgi:integrase